ncbi:hypothetical protein GCM10008941_14340 [Rhizomicrobium palustre]
MDRAAKPAMDAFFERFRDALPEDEPEIEAKAETQNGTAVIAPCGPETTEDIPALPPHKGAHSKVWAYAGAAAGAVIAAGAVLLFRHHKKAS